ncbi:hypothetical protein BPAE_0380g00060 [Botrytis paeoniae]|uniref:Uncharacterized protein n=1 Tax=Botrytis paeoniae TaxID=278948 RepID=A0A4Z1F268_9HELO|nr:hypothetical protein BPAE_0380g00060 [Botrytis paeoniae]
MTEQLCIDINFAHKVEKFDKFVGGNNTAILFTCLPLKQRLKINESPAYYGETLEFEYFKLNKGLQHKTSRNARVERRCKYARFIADFVAAIDKIELPGYGFFVAPTNMPHKGIKIEVNFQLSQDSIDGIRIPSELNFPNWVNNILNAQMQRTSDIFLKLSPVEV